MKSTKDIKEEATVANVNGMGDISLPNGDAEGSGDVPTSSKKKKKVRSIEDIINDINDEDEVEITEEQSKIIIDILLNPENLNESQLSEALSSLDEGIIGSIAGTVGGFAFGKSIGKLLANVLGIKDESPLYGVLTSRLVGTAIGRALGKKLKF